MTWLLSRVIDRGTATRSAADIAEELDSRGITLTIIVTRHAVLARLHAASPKTSSRSSRCSATSSCRRRCRRRRSRRARARSSPSIRQDEDNPAIRATETLMALLYPDGHPYGRRTKGSIDIVEQLTREQLVRAARRALRARRADGGHRRRRRPGARAATSTDARLRRLEEAGAAAAAGAAGRRRDARAGAWSSR